MRYPRTMNHVGITVTDIGAAVEWYCETFGCSVLMAPIGAKEDGSHFSDIIADIFGPGFGEMRLAHLATGDGVGIELFEFTNPKSVQREDNFEYWKAGIFHICMTDPDIEGLAKRIAETGGKQRSKVWRLFDDKPYKVCYCQDPWGNIIELSSHNYVQVWSNYDQPHQP
jgi:catechol 2,3-dioxygenase-like lactoylglutathione lyase family enzyme